VILDVETHTLKIVNAGHPAPLVRRRDGSIEEIGRETAGFPLAIDGSTEYETYVARLEPGEIVVLYTDGVTDAMSATGDRFSDARLREVLARPHASPRDAAEATLRAIRSHAAACPQFDDITLVAFGRLAPAAPTWEL
jgi:sigma-B regulation protein RsbU (phosphoserine phosphatase)